MTDVINELKAERDMLRDRLARIETAIEEYESWERSVAHLMGAEKLPPANGSGIRSATEQTPMAAFEEEVRALLGRASAPLKRTEVYDELTRAGVVVGGKEPLNTVASRLSRMKGVTNLKGFGYWASDRPYPQAGHSEGTSSASDLFKDDSGDAAEDLSLAAETDESGVSEW